MQPDKDFVLIIEPGKAEKHYWIDVWHYRELFYILAWRDIKVRYKQTVLGAAWSIIRPLLTMIIFTVVFGKLGKFPTEGAAPYAVMVYAAMLPWQFFSNSLSEASLSLLQNVNLITKVYFPRLIIPASAIITSIVDFFISLIILVALIIYYQYIPSWHLVFFPFFLVGSFMASFGMCLFFSAMNVTYRDFRYIVPFIVQFGLYISPVGFSSSIVPEKWKLLYYMNPMVGVIDGFRWSIIGTNNIYWPGFIMSNVITIIIFFFGLNYFRKTEKSFADKI